jgi:multidrug efflux pump subunit AcrB
MGIVRFALRLPHTFYVLAALVLFLGGTAVLSMPTDIFPEINIPVVTIIWQYTGLSTPEMEQRVTTYGQYALSSSVNGIRDIEAQTINGISVQKVFFQPDVNLDLAISQIVSATNFIRVVMPPGIQAPVVVQYNASSVPVLQIGLSSETLNEQQLYDYGIYRLRQQLAPIHGVTLPTPAGGKYRQIMVDIDPLKLQARGLTPLDVVNAVSAQNLTVPSGTTKIGDTQFSVRTNAVPATIDDLNNIPVKFVNGATVFVKDVGQVHDGNAVQQNIVRTDGRRSVLLSIIKNGNASTVAVVNGVKEALKIARQAAPSGMQINELFDQSVFVKASIQGLLKEGAIAAGLTALMIVLFLGSWRSTLVVMISIPLSILSSLIALYFLGYTINTMTLGGLALAIGILVDDSTVTIENTHRLLTEERMPLPAATLHGAAGIAVPTLVSTLAISCVFVSVVFLRGPAKYLFTPLGLAVVFAMLASYGFSRTLTPITIGLLLKGERHGGQASRGWFARLFAGFERAFEAMRNAYTEVLHALLTRRILVLLAAVVVLGLGGTLFFFVGRDFFPIIDGGQIQLHVRAPAGTRIEKTEQIFQAIEDKIREVIPENQRELIVDNIGLPARSYNYAFGDGTAIGVNDGVILVALKEGHAPTGEYISKLRQVLPATFPENVFYFQAADMVTQILNFGIPAQIDIRTVGYDRAKNLRIAKDLQRRIAAIPGVADAHLQQEVNAPELFAEIDRARATQFGLTATGIALNLNTSLSSSQQLSPNFWTDPSNGTPYYLAVQTPEYRVNSLNELKNTPVTTFTVSDQNPVPGLLSNVATLKRHSTPTNANQANVQPVYEVYANAEGRDLGSISTEINKVVAEYQKQMSPGNRIEIVGQIESMNGAFRDLAIGILFAAVFVYLLMVVNYRNWGDP